MRFTRTVAVPEASQFMDESTLYADYQDDATRCGARSASDLANAFVAADADAVSLADAAETPRAERSSKPRHFLHHVLRLAMRLSGEPRASARGATGEPAAGALLPARGP